MNLKKIFFSAVTVSVLCALTGCDYIQEGKPESSLLKQEEEHNNKIVLLEKQQAQLKSQLETIQKQQTGIINSTKTLTHGSDSNLLIVLYVQIMPDDLVMQLHRF